MNSHSFLVTGASGFVGRQLCRRLRAAGYPVRGLVRRADPALEALGVQLVLGDIATTGPWGEAVGEVDCVIHCAARAAFGSGGEYEIANVTGTRNVLAAAGREDGRLRRFVYVSTIGVLDRRAGDSCRTPLDESSPAYPSSDYGRSKFRAEQLVRESGLPFSIVRPAMVIGREMRLDSHFAVFARMALRGAPVAHFAWTGRFSVVHVDDLAAALELCATHAEAAGRIFFCAGTPVALRDCFEQAQPGRWRIPMQWAAAAARVFPQIVPFKLKAMLLPALTASDEALRNLGWKPQKSTTETLEEIIARERARLDPEADPGGQTVITGAASGLGRALAGRLAGRRADLLLVDQDAAGLAQVRAAHPHCRIHVVDLADQDAVADFVRSEDWMMHPVREIYACAGIGLRGPVLSADTAQHVRLFQVNVLTRLALAQAALPGMMREQLGRIVLISSSSAFQPLPYLASYAASNAALLLLGEAWAAELAGSGVHMMSVCPGGMRTNFQQAAGVRRLDGERLMPPDAVAEKILRALRRHKGTVIISSRALAMALAARVLPRAVAVALWKFLMNRLR